MPKQKITREMVVEAAFQLARKHGLDKVIVRDIAEELGCSVQPIYSYCKNMEGLRKDVMERANVFMREFVISHIDREDFFRSTGFAYIQLALNEPNVYKMCLINERPDVNSLDSFYNTETNPHVPIFLAEQMGVSVEKAKMLHLNLLIYTRGICTIAANASQKMDIDEISNQITIAYKAFSRQMLETDDY